MRFDVNLEGQGVIGVYDTTTKRFYLMDGHGLQSEQISRMKEILRNAPSPPPNQPLPLTVEGTAQVLE